MKANIQGIEVTGTPEEIAELIRLSRSECTTGSLDSEKELNIYKQPIAEPNPNLVYPPSRDRKILDMLN